MSSMLRERAVRVSSNGTRLLPVQGKTPANSVLPLVYDEAKGKRVPSWLPLARMRQDEQLINSWFQNPQVTGVAGIMGTASGGLVALDFDHPPLFDAWLSAMREVPNFNRIADRLAIQQTGSGGYQVWVRTTNPGRNKKLAWVADTASSTGTKVGIETRGEGGYAVMAPSLHPSGNPYVAIQDMFDDIIQISESGWHMMQMVSSELSTASPRITHSQSSTGIGHRSARMELTEEMVIIDLFNRANRIRDLLLRKNYTNVGHRMARPDRKVASISLFGEDECISYHHSSNDTLGQTPVPFHDAFSVFRYLYHDGRFYDALEDAGKQVGVNYIQPFNRSSVESLAQTVHDRAFAYFPYDASSVLVIVPYEPSCPWYDRLAGHLRANVLAINEHRAWDVAVGDLLLSMRHVFAWMPDMLVETEETMKMCGVTCVPADAMQPFDLFDHTREDIARLMKSYQ